MEGTAAYRATSVRLPRRPGGGHRASWRVPRASWCCAGSSQFSQTTAFRFLPDVLQVGITRPGAFRLLVGAAPLNKLSQAGVGYNMLVHA